MDASMQAALNAAGLTSFVPVVLALHTLASALDAAIPQPKPGSHWLPLRKLLTIAALGVGNASPACQPALITWAQRIAGMLVAILPPPPAAAPPAAPLPPPLPAATPLFPPPGPVQFNPQAAPVLSPMRIEPTIAQATGSGALAAQAVSQVPGA